LPILFVCEDNQWSATTKTGAMSAGEGAAARARAHGITAEMVDGNDAWAVHEAAKLLIADIRAGKGPRLLHARTYRFKGHVSVDPASYRDPAELQAALGNDPLGIAVKQLQDCGLADAAIEQIMQAARDEVAAALQSAAAAPWPETGSAYTQIQDIGAGQWL
jgi:TPP-dependent pyruvate/acetoin dehydrogenase alpha subunit